MPRTSRPSPATRTRAIPRVPAPDTRAPTREVSATFEGTTGSASPIANETEGPRPAMLKTPPPGVQVIPNDTGAGTWAEKWRHPTTGKWVYNYTLEQVERAANAKFKDNVRVGRT